jgi:hypothetical protein
MRSYVSVYQYNDRLSQLFTKVFFLALATMFQPLSGSSSGLYNELKKCSNDMSGFYQDYSWQFLTLDVTYINS